MSDAPIARRVLEAMRRQMASKVQDLSAFRTGKAAADALQSSVVRPESLEGSDPAHALYTIVQNQMSVMAEQLLQLDEMRVFAKLIGEADHDYLPSWPPMSPITKSYFWCWSNLDLTANAHRETLGSVIVRVASQYGMHANMLALMKTFNESRMGLYRVDGVIEGGVHLRDLATGERFVAICHSGYSGVAGELWFTRVLPPPIPGRSEHVVFTSPYILIAPDEADWLRYLDRIAAQDPKRPRRAVLERHFTSGPSRRYWTEFVFEGYVNHTPGAIYLKGLPDLPASRPHSREYPGHAHGR